MHISIFILILAALLSGCSRAEAGTVYGPADAEENLYIDLTAEEAREEYRKGREPVEAVIADSGYTITEIDESDVYPPRKTDSEGNPLPAYLADFAVIISNREGDRALVRPTVTAVAVDMYGNTISTSEKTIRTCILPGDEIAYAADMTIRGECPYRIRFSAACTDPEDYEPSPEELDMPSSDAYQTGQVHVQVDASYAQKAPSAGRKNSPGLSDGYFRFGELPVLTGEVSCDWDRGQEAFVTVLYRDGNGHILGGETGRAYIPRGQAATYTFTAAAPIPEDAQALEASAFSIAAYYTHSRNGLPFRE